MISQLITSPKRICPSIPDGHVIEFFIEIDNRYIGVGFGFSIVKLTDERLWVIWIDESSEAYTQRMRTGAELVEWNGLSGSSSFE